MSFPWKRPGWLGWLEGLVAWWDDSCSGLISVESKNCQVEPLDSKVSANHIYLCTYWSLNKEDVFLQTYQVIVQNSNHMMTWWNLGFATVIWCLEKDILDFCWSVLNTTLFSRQIYKHLGPNQNHVSQHLHMDLSKNSGFSPPNHPLKIGLIPLFFTIHFGGPPLIFEETPISTSLQFTHL